MVHHVVAGKAGNRKYDKILICFGRGSRTHAHSTMSVKFGVKEWTNFFHAQQNWNRENSRKRIRLYTKFYVGDYFGNIGP